MRQVVCQNYGYWYQAEKIPTKKSSQRYVGIHALPWIPGPTLAALIDMRSFQTSEILMVSPCVSKNPDMRHQHGDFFLFRVVANINLDLLLPMVHSSKFVQVVTCVHLLRPLFGMGTIFWFIVFVVAPFFGCTVRFFHRTVFNSCFLNTCHMPGSLC